MQQGGSASPFDRNMGTKMAAKAVDGLTEQIKLAKRQPDGSIYINTPHSAVMMGVIRRQYKLTPLEYLKADTDFE
jgi:6-phosphofructokinase 1